MVSELGQQTAQSDRQNRKATTIGRFKIGTGKKTADVQESKERERSMAKPFKPETRNHRNWSVTIDVCSAEVVGFYTKCISPNGTILCTEICNDKGSAWQQGYNLVDRAIKEERTNRYNRIAIPLTLALLYVSGADEEDELGHQSRFRGRRAWKGHDFEILDLLTEDGLLEAQRKPQQIKSVVLTAKGIKQARHILTNLNLEGIE